VEGGRGKPPSWGGKRGNSVQRRATLATKKIFKVSPLSVTRQKDQNNVDLQWRKRKGGGKWNRTEKPRASDAGKSSRHQDKESWGSQEELPSLMEGSCRKSKGHRLWSEAGGGRLKNEGARSKRKITRDRPEED